MIDLPGFHDLIASAWSLDCVGSPLTQFSAKFKHAKLKLCEFNTANDRVQTNVQAARSNLLEFQDNHGCSDDPLLLAQERDLISKLNTCVGPKRSFSHAKG